MKRLVVIAFALFSLTNLSYGQALKNGEELFSEEKPIVDDDVVYKYENPTNAQIDEWKTNNCSVCKRKIGSECKEYDISEEMVKNDPCLIYLILHSEALDTKEDKEEWFMRYNFMTQEQIYRLYVILYEEKYELMKIENH